MSNAVVGALRVTLGMDSAAFTEGLSQAQKQLKDAGSKLQSIGAKMGTVGLAVGAALGGAFAAVTSVTSGLVELGNEAKTAGVGFEAFQKWKYVADQAGVGVEALTDGLKEMQLRADEFAVTGKGSAAEAFARIGLSAKDMKKALEDPAAMFDDIIARMGKLDTAAQIRVADEIFGGTGGEQFVRLLGLGTEGIAKLKDEFVANGGLIPEEQLAKAAEFQQSMGKLKAAFAGLATNALMDSGLLEFFTAALPKITAFGKALLEYLGPKLAPIFDAFIKVVQSLATVVMSIFGDNGSASSGVITFGEIIKRIFEASLQTITGMLNVVGNLLNAFAALLRGDWSAMWTALGDAVKAVGSMILAVFNTLQPGVVASVSRMVTAVRDWLVNRFQSMVVEPVRRKVEAVKGFFFGLYDAVVGNSYIPDMVEGVAAWMAKLDAGMVVPAKRATDEAKQAFQKLRDDVAVIMEGLLTDAERNAREVAAKIAKIRALAAQGGMGAGEARSAEAGVWGEDLENKPIVKLGSLGDDGKEIQRALEDGTKASREAFDELAEYFGDTFASNMERALRGDIKGVFMDILSDGLRSTLANLGSNLFKGGKAGGGIFGSLLGMLGGKLPGFARGGSFNVAGSGTTDSKVVAFRATPGERVDISTPRQQRQSGGGGGSLIQVAPSKFFDVHVREIATPLMMAGSQATLKAAQAIIPSQMANQAMYGRGRRIR